MDEEKDQQVGQAPQPDSQDLPPSPAKRGDKPMTKGQRQRRQRSVFQYIAILFAAAFLLLLYSFMMERRQYQSYLEQNQEQIDSLQQSASGVQRLDALYEENAKLKEQVADLEEQLADANDQLDVLPDVISHQEHVLSETCRALDHFWQIDEAYVRGRYSLCRELIQEMEATENGQTPLKDYLPKESTTDNGRFSPYDRYLEIYEALY